MSWASKATTAASIPSLGGPNRDALAKKRSYASPSPFVLPGAHTDCERSKHRWR
jgi:hypothetical protein